MRWNWGSVGMVVFAGWVGGMVGRVSGPQPVVRAQEKFAGVTNCVTVVPKAWGDFRGASDYGLAFEDGDGVVRFVLHPSCGSVNSPAEPVPAPIDLEVQRR